MTNKNEKMIKRILLDNVLYEYGGWWNMLQDGEMTHEEYGKIVTVENMEKTCLRMIREAIDSGRLESEDTGYSIEGKHINFLGNVRLEQIAREVAEKAIAEF